MTHATAHHAPNLLVPKLFTILRQGYHFDDFRHDALAGLTVAIVALPLAMALAIASGTTPDKGLITAIVAGLIISALGGSRVQIGGPTGAFVVVVFNIIQQFGYNGMIVATLMAGFMLVAAGLLGLGTYVKYIPQSVIKGFTAGIAIIIATSQVGTFMGLTVAHEPGDPIGKWQAYFAAIGTMQPMAVALGVLTFGVIVGYAKYLPKWPGFLLAVSMSSLFALALHLQIPTIGSRFGGIPHELPMPSLPHATWEQMRLLFPSALTIAVLAGIESLLSAVVADGMIGRQHRSNCELVAQGVANAASALFGGLPATGAIARTAANIRSGARSPVAGIMHAVWLLAIMLAAAPLASYVPLTSLAAVLFIVAWNMSEARHLPGYLRHASHRDRIVLAVTFALTVLIDLSVAIGVGIALSAVMGRGRKQRHI
ncbi:MAG: SulP family inorganic anion transporter [Alphaproteobacteria bacterium]